MSSAPHTPTAAAPVTASRGLPPVVYLLGAVTFLIGTSELIVAGLLPDIAAALHTTVSRAGLMITLFAAGMIIGAPVMALATMRLPRRATLILALVVFGIAHVLSAVSTDLTVVLVARFVAGIATGTFWAVGFVVAVAASGQAAAARATGILVLGITLANIVGVPLGTALGQALTWQGPFWILAGLSLATALLLTWVLPPDVRGHRATLREEVASIRRPRLWAVYLATALIQAAFLAPYSYVAPLLTDQAGLPAALVPLAMLGYGIGGVVGNILGGRLGDRRPYGTVNIAVGLLAVVLAAIVWWATSSVVAVILIALVGVFGFVGNPIMMSLIARASGPANTLAIALGTSAIQIGVAAGSALGGTAFDSGLGVRGPTVVGFTAAVLALFTLLALTATRARAASADAHRVQAPE
ncbi:MFS transporter [Leucobacter sp. wl10]|uniref:MFS transporter n=1 Tax=Leucobacter sp. wl10 TaxID=2304677 RepID=UPI0013C3360A|nr:MFS transporter [Leucobacter sp. wl10]